LTQLAALTGLDVSTSHRILKCLVDEEMIEQRAQGKVYALGSLSLELGLVAMQRSVLLNRAIPAMRAIAQETDDTVYLLVRSGDDALCMHREEGAFRIKTLMLDIGGRRALGMGAGGLHLLSALDDADIVQICERNRHALIECNSMTVNDMLILAREARQLGYGISRDRITNGVTGLGVNIPVSVGIPYAAISVVAISSRLTPERYDEVLRIIKRSIVKYFVTRS
jgi:DNA-binding IclR family transcriptional regulator